MIKKFNKFLLVVLVATFACFFASCDKEQSAEFKQASLIMSINQEINLEDLVELTNCNLEDVVFESSNDDVVFVKQNVTLISRAVGTAIITIKDFDGAILEVSVIGETVNFSAPTNLRYEESESAVVWDSANVGSVYATEYDVTLKKDQGEEQTTRVVGNKIQVPQAGSYTIKVASVGRLGILSSDFSDELTFVKLAAPSELVYNDVTKELCWNGNGSTTFKVKINGVEGNTINGNRLQIDLDRVGDYEISVIASSNAENVFGAESVEKLELSRLASPVLNFNNGIMSWNYASEKALYFKVEYKTSSGDMQASQIPITTRGVYEFDLTSFSNDTYEIRVIAIGENERVLSASSATYEFTKYESPFNLVYDDISGKLTWDSTNGEKFVVIINGVETDVLTQKQYIVDTSDPGIYEFTVKSISDNSLSFGGTSSEKIKITRLAAPNLTINNAVLSWSGYNGKECGYILQIFGESQFETGIELNDLNEYSYNLQSLDAGTYSAKVKALGEDVNVNSLADGDYVLESDWSQIDNITKNQQVSISYIESDQKIVVDNFNVNYNLKLKLIQRFNDNSVSEFDISTTGQKQFGFNVAGQYEFEVINIAKSNFEIDSISSNIVKVVKLPKAENVTHKIEDGKYIIENYNVTGADDYIIEIVKGSNSKIYTEQNNLLSELFDAVGTYSVKIIASAQSSQIAYTIGSVVNTNLKVTKPNNVAPVVNASKMQITWSPIISNAKLTYHYKLSGDVTQSGTTDKNYFEYKNLPVGDYTFTIWTENETITGGTEIILATNETATTFEVSENLVAPEALFVKDNESGNEKYYIEINPVENATHYLIKNDGNDLTRIEYSENKIIYEVTDIVNGIEQETTFKVIAENRSNQHIGNSAETLVKIVRATAPTSFEMDANETITSSSMAGWFENCEIVIVNNDTELEYNTNTLTAPGLIGASSYTVKIKYIANNNKVNNSYYLDSYWTSFDLERSVVSTQVKNNKLSWENTSGQKLLTISQEGTQSTQRDVSNLTEFDFYSIDQNKYDLTLGVSLKFQNKVNRLQGTIVGLYFENEFVNNLQEKTQISSKKYTISSNADEIFVKLADEEINIELQEVGEKVAVSFNEKQNATYNLFGVEDYEFSSDDILPGNEYRFGLEEILNGIKTVYLFTVNRLTGVQSIKVDSEENLSVLTYPNGAESVEFKIDGTIVNNVQAVSSTGSKILARFIRTDNKVNDNKFTLNGFDNEFNFVRLLDYSREISINNNVVTIVAEDDANLGYSYELLFADEDDTKFIKRLEVSTNLTLNLLDEVYSNIIYSLGENKTLCLKKITKSSSVQKDGTIYLTSSYSQPKLLKVLDAPKNLRIVMGQDLDQSNFTIECELNESQINAGYEYSKFDIKVYYNNQEQEIDVSKKQIPFVVNNTIFNRPGEWRFVVRAEGTNDTITSIASELTVTRLPQTNNIAISNTGLVTWSAVTNASSYILIYKDVNTDGNILQAQRNLNSLSYQLTSEELELNFDGNILFTLYAVGNGQTTLSSEKIVEYRRECAPEIEMSTNYLTVKNYQEYNNVSIYVKANIDNYRVLNEELSLIKDDSNNYIWNYPISYSYVQNGHVISIDFAQAKDIDFTFFAVSKNANVLNSNNVDKSATKLAEISEIGFYRGEDNEIRFSALNSNSQNSDSQIRFAGRSIDLSVSNIDIEIKNDWISSLNEDWELSIYAKGIVLADKIFIDGPTKTISGKKLGTVNNVKTKNGAIVWDGIANAEDYAVNVDNLQTILNHRNGLKETLTGDEYTAGLHSICVKAIGNIGQVKISSNIILDGGYSDVIEVTKLDKISNIDVKNGLLTFEGVENAEKHKVILYKNYSTPVGEFDLNVFEGFIPGETITYYNSENLFRSMNSYTEYYLKFYASSDEDGFINSDLSTFMVAGEQRDYLLVEKMPIEENSITLSHPKVNEVTDYSKTIAALQESNLAVSGILLMTTFNESANVEFIQLHGYDNSFVYQLDANGDWAPGAYTIRYAQLGSNEIDANGKTYLTSGYGEEIIVTKLSQSVLSCILNDRRESSVRYSSVTGADAYYCYIGDTLYGLLLGSGDKEINLDSLQQGDYSGISIVAVNTTDINKIASVPSILKDNEENIIAIKKIFSPSGLEMSDGSLYFQLADYNVTNAFIKGGTTESQIFTGKTLFDDQRIRVKFTNTQTQENFIFEDYLSRFLKFTDSQIDQFGKYSSFDSYIENNTDGFPSIEYGFNDFAQMLKAGEYSISFQILGNQIYNNQLLISSNYSEGVVKYVAAAPMIRIENNDDVFNLKFKNVTVNEKYFNQDNTPQYAIIGSYRDSVTQQTKREVLTTVSSSGVNNAEIITVILSELVENDILTSKYTAIEVCLIGDDGSVLNGRVSNYISIEVLEPISASVQHGIFKWSAQLSATKYLISYGSNIKSINADETKSVMEWDCAELEEGQKYKIQAYAYGSLEKNPIGTVIISGKVVDLGEIQKLSSISGLEIANGVFVWNGTEFATGYDVFVFAEEEDINLEDYITVVENNYMTTVNHNDASKYVFRSVGTEEISLNEESFAYVNSTKTPAVLGERMPDVTEVGAVGGLLKWTYVFNDVWFKITVNKVQAYDFDSEGLIINVPYNQVAKDGVCYLDLNNYASLNDAGVYNINIQAYYVNQTRVEETDSTYYLISKDVITQFTKLAPVEQIEVNNGSIILTYVESQIAHYFKMEFVYNGKTEIRFVDENSFIDVISRDNIQDNISLFITAIPGRLGEENENLYLMSSTTEYESYLYQLNKLDFDTIRLSVKDNGKLFITWSNPNGTISDSNYVYEIAYKLNLDDEFRYVQVDSESHTFGEGDDNFAIDDKLYYAIRVKAEGRNYLSSGYSELKMIELPKAVNGLEYNEDSLTFTWTRYEVEQGLESSINYKIKDEIGNINGQGEFVAQRVLLLDANVGDENFAPFVVGVHRVSVAAIIKNGNSDDLISSYTTPIICQFNIFESGEGTEQNPYIIANENQFNNIKYRLEKDGKNNRYFECSLENGIWVVPELITYVGSSNNVYHFRQSANLTISKDYTLANKVKDGYLTTDNYEFNGNYNGNFYRLELVWDEAINTSLPLSKLSIFEKIGQSGVVRNVELRANIASTSITKVFTFSILTYENSGTITNVKIGTAGNEFKLESRSSISFTFIAYDNRGIINGIKNNYDVQISSQTGYVNFATVAINNYKQIAQAQNIGKIQITANYTQALGGVVAYMYDKNSSISQSSNLGDFVIYLRNNSTSNIGGVIGINNQAAIAECYSICDISVYTSTTLTNANVGGLIGQSTGDNIARSYVAVTKNNTVISGSSAYANIYSMIGKLTSHQSGDVKAYYLQQSGMSVVNTTSDVSGAYIGFTGTPNLSNTPKLFEAGSGFSVANRNQNGYPILEWETAFANLSWIN